MDVLYGDLENYQHENVISELRNENRELKWKLDEYASTLARLQKDFDNLSAEYKKLESNYSSLLKTARAEIERKSQLITNLNLEKDKLVIESFQNRGWIHRPRINNEDNQQPGGQQTGYQQAGNPLPGNLHAEYPQAGNQQTGHQHTGNQPVNNTNSVKELKEAPATNSTAKNVTGISQINNETKQKPDKKRSPDHIFKGEVNAKDKEQTLKGSDNNKDRDIDKNNYKKSGQDYADDSSRATGGNKLSKIKNRRKSMPLPSREDCKFSSDEDQNDDLRDNRFRRKSPLRDTIDRKHHETNRNGRHYPERKVPEIPRLGDRHGSNYDSTKDVYRKNNNWHRDSDRRRSRDNKDKYEASQRSRRHYSPVRPQYNMQDEYYNKHRGSNDMLHWSDNNRYRVLESPPPPDNYTQHRRSRDSDKTRYDRIQNQEVYPMKHKVHSITEQPPIKRPRSESLNKHSDKNINFHQDKDFCSHITATSKPVGFPYLSLQSPDHIHLENHPVHHIKEIMGTAVTKLDDPRLTSKKYVVSTHDDKVVLSTVGKAVDIKVIDTTKWDIYKDKEIHKMPTLLRERPQISEDLVKNIYIDHPLSNMSLESGEICLEEEETHRLSNNKSRLIEENSIIKNQLQNQIQTQEQVHVDIKEATVTQPNLQQTSPTTYSKNYRIRKINKQSSSKPLVVSISHSTHKNPDKKDIMKESHKKKINKEKTGVGEKLQSRAEDQHYNPLKMFSDAIDICKNKSNKFVDISHRKHSSDKILTSAKDTVEGDLELSDETCDYTEASDEIKYNKEKNFESEECKKKSVFESINREKRSTKLEKKDSKEILETCDYTEATDEIRYDKEKNVESEECKEKSVFESINRETRSSKLEKKDSKEILVFKHGKNKAENKHFDKQVKTREDHLKQSKEKNKLHKDDKSKDIKSKLCDLFGETSSLITPEDLGIVPPSTSTTKENLNAYTPLYDNTQDAVDLNIEEMEKVQTRLIKLNPDEPLPKEAEKDVISDKKEKIKKTKKDEKQKSKSSSAKTSPIHQMFQNINTETAKEDDKTVKTVIISTGMQNNCQTSGSIQEKQEKQLSNIQRKINENAQNCPLLNLTALATSTPHKEINLEPSLLLPESSCNSSKSVTKEASDITSGNRKRNSDEPDLRIIVKRRRKHKGKPS